MLNCCARNCRDYSGYNHVPIENNKELRSLHNVKHQHPTFEEQ